MLRSSGQGWRGLPMRSCSGAHRWAAAALLLAAAPATADITAHYVNATKVIISIGAKDGDAGVDQGNRAGANSFTIEADGNGDTRITQGNQYGVLTRGDMTWILLS